jgi:hypothetical protein
MMAKSIRDKVIESARKLHVLYCDPFKAEISEEEVDAAAQELMDAVDELNRIEGSSGQDVVPSPSKYDN